MASPRNRRTAIQIFEDPDSDPIRGVNDDSSGGEHSEEELDHETDRDSQGEEGKYDEDLDFESEDDEPVRAIEYDHDTLSDPLKPVKSLENSHHPSESFSTTSGVHLDSRQDPHLNYIEVTTPTPDENVPDPFYTSTISNKTDGDIRKISEATSTLPDELEYYRSPLPGRAPLGTTSNQTYARASNTPSRSMPYPVTHSRSKSAARHDSRPLFQSPSSVRAMQMSSPPPFEPSPLSPRSRSVIRNPHPADSPRASARIRQSNSPFISHSSNGTPTRRLPPTASPSRQTPLKSNQELPLVLLHCNFHISPLLSHSPDALAAINAAPRLQRDAALLKQKLDPTLLDRGVLIPHPGEDYELLEERVLESLELRRPRVGACGHYRRASNRSDCQEAEAEEAHMHCTDCDRPVANALQDVETQAALRRWDVRVYAANGLMRAGAWSAAWREMEKVDVEVGVWLREEEKDLGPRLEEWERGQRAKAEPESALGEGADALGEFVSPVKTRAASGRRGSLGEPAAEESKRAATAAEMSLGALLVKYVRRQVQRYSLVCVVFLVMVGMWAYGPLGRRDAAIGPALDVAPVSIVDVTATPVTVMQTVTQTAAGSVATEAEAIGFVAVEECVCGDLKDAEMVSVPKGEWERVRAAAALVGVGGGVCLAV